MEIGAYFFTFFIGLVLLGLGIFFVFLTFLCVRYISRCRASQLRTIIKVPLTALLIVGSTVFPILALATIPSGVKLLLAIGPFIGKLL